jgi:hypothetical protein
MSQLNRCIFREGGLAVTPLQAKYALGNQSHNAKRVLSETGHAALAWPREH